MVFHIAGYVVKCVMKTITCLTCSDAIVCESAGPLISFKSRGGLLKPFPDVVKLLRIAEIELRVYTAKGAIKGDDIQRMKNSGAGSDGGKPLPWFEGPHV